MKKLLLSLIGIIYAFAFSASAQINITQVDPGPYTPGSSIAAIFTVNPGTCIDKTATFQLFLSDANGSFANEVQIGTYNGFYSTFVNGIIPAGTLPGSGYLLRVKVSNTAIASAPSIPITMVAGTPLKAELSAITMDSSNPDIFGGCSPRTNQAINFTNNSTTGSIVNAIFKNEITGLTELNHTFTSQNKTFTPGAAHYTITTKVTRDGTVATKANFLVNNAVNNSFQTGNNDVKCLPSDPLFFMVDTRPEGIGNNFPGFLYNVDWGDNTLDTYTFCEIVNNGNRVQHMYTKSSCGESVTLNGVKINNVFAININPYNPICATNVGSPLATTARVATKPKNMFEGPRFGCTGASVTFENRSTPGENPVATASNCEPNKIKYYWYVDGVQASEPLLLNDPFNYTFNTPGKHVIVLKSISEGACNGDDSPPFEICIQNKPIPSFSFGANTTYCEPKPALKVTNNSTIDTNCDPTVNYQWTVTPAVTFANGTKANSKEPEFNFMDAGIYTVTLEITTASCGTVTSAPQTIVVNAIPTATLSADASLCTRGIYNFNASTAGPTKTILEGTFRDEPTTYTWTVSGGNFNFANNTDKNFKYPDIEFLDNATYTITVVHTNSCGTTSDTQILTFSDAPQVDPGNYSPICYDTPTIQLNGAITGATTSVTGIKWTGGGGTFSPNDQALNAVYTPTQAERAALTINLKLTATTSLAAPCNVIERFVTISFKPEVTVTSENAKTICTETAVNYSPTSATAGTTFTWTATGTNASGFSNGSGSTINDVITNTSATSNATVTYTITPTGDGCTGTPFTLTVTVTPKPIITTSGNKTICSQQTSAITISSNLLNTVYTWSSVATGVITGNTSNSTATALTEINEQLFNSGTTTETVTYTITPISENGCSGTPVVVVITVEPQPTTPQAGQDEEICNTNTYTLKGNQPSVGTGKWTQVTTFPNVTFSNETQFNAVVSGLQPNNTYIFRWTITGAATCDPKVDEVSITVNPTSVGGTTSGAQTVCAGSNSGTVSLTGQVGSIIRWETSPDGTNWTPVTETTSSLSYLNLITTTHYRAVVKSGSCPESFSTVTIITVAPGTVAAQAGADQQLCDVTSTTITANDPGTFTGTWTLTSGQTGVTFMNPNSSSTLVNGLVAGQVYQFTWTISGVSPCPPTSDELVVNILRPIANNTISALSTTICSGQTITISGATPTGGNGVFTYVWESSPNGNAPWTVVSGENQKDLTVAINSTVSYRRMVTSGACPSTSNTLTFNVLPPIANNTIGPPSQVICTNTAPVPFLGSIPTGGDGSNYTYAWQSSTDNVTWTTIPGANGQNYQSPALTRTTYFRRTVSTTTCNGPQSNPSASIVVTVNPDAKAEFNPGTQVRCAPFNLANANIQLIPHPDRNVSYEWFVDGVSAGTGPTPNYIIQLPNETHQVKLVARSRFNCKDNETLEIPYSTQSEVTASFEPTLPFYCGQTNVAFKNTSSIIAGAKFEWFVNGDKKAETVDFNWTFDPNVNGIDQVYNVVLKVTTECDDDQTPARVIRIKSKPPTPSLVPDKQIGCATLKVIFDNISSGKESNRYEIDFGDGTGIKNYNWGDVITYDFPNTTTTTKSYEVTIKAINECGSTVGNKVTISVLPSTISASLLFVNPTQQTVCVGETVLFQNNTTGAVSYLYKFDDGSNDELINTPGQHVFSHTFTKAGLVTITMMATSDCAGTASVTRTVNVVAKATAAFEAVKTTGCPGTIVQFKNESVGAARYVWNFGDGSQPSSETNPVHPYNSAGRFRVTLTAYNSLDCSTTEIKNEYVVISPLPNAEFQVLPGNTIGVPNFTFNFSDLDKAILPGYTYTWDFGEGGAPIAGKTPSYTYKEPGKYTVTYTVRNPAGCENTRTQEVEITGVAGYLHVPNSFIPGGTSVPLQTFYAVGSGIASWRMSVFNKWGQVLWETTKLDDGKPIEGWDGTFKGVPQPQGIYFWKIEVNFINGTEWKGVTYDRSAPKRTGEIYLIR